jgi:hypothetical protein
MRDALGIGSDPSLSAGYLLCQKFYRLKKLLTCSTAALSISDVKPPQVTSPPPRSGDGGFSCVTT